MPQLLHKVARSASRVSPLVLVLGLAAFLTPYLTNDFYLMELLAMALLFGLFAGSWDILSGFTDQPNFGHALFIGGAGYLSAIMTKNMDWSFWVSVPLSAIIAAAAGAFIGTLTLRLRGPYFALSTLAFSAVFYKMLYILRPVTGGDEGITGLDPFSMTIDGDLQVTAVIFIICVFLMTAFAGSRYGLILRATRHNEEAAQASGVNTAYYKIIGFAVSAFFAGIAG